MFGLALKNLIIVSMRNHVYSFKNEYFLQKERAATGLDETGELADLVMLWWDLMFTCKVKELDLSIDLYKRFKDDCNIVMEGIPLELDYDDSTAVMVRKSTTQLGGDISVESHTAKVLNRIADSIHEMINFTSDIPSNHSDGFLPVLDVKVQLSECGNIIYQFFEKPTKHPKVILADSALSWQQKRTILTQEALRRLRNTSVELGTEVQNKHLTDFMLKMKDSGYSERFRKEIVSSAQSAFKKILENHKNGTRPIHRSREQMLNDKGAKNSSGYAWWNKGLVEYTTVLYVPPTPNGVLLKMLKS